MKSHKRTGFSLIEILVVIGIIAIMAVVSVPNFYIIREKDKKADINLVLSELDSKKEYIVRSSASKEDGVRNSCA